MSTKDKILFVVFVVMIFGGLGAFMTTAWLDSSAYWALVVNRLPIIVPGLVAMAAGAIGLSMLDTPKKRNELDL